LDNICFEDGLLLPGDKTEDGQTRRKWEMVMMAGARAGLTTADEPSQASSLNAMFWSWSF
jgi:hypothetical protein